jgi:hypothetical protein
MIPLRLLGKPYRPLPYLTRRPWRVIVAVYHQESERYDDEVDLEHTHLTIQGFSVQLIHNDPIRSRNHRAGIVSESQERFQTSSKQYMT